MNPGKPKSFLDMILEQSMKNQPNQTPQPEPSKKKSLFMLLIFPALTILAFSGILCLGLNAISSKFSVSFSYIESLEIYLSAFIISNLFKIAK